MVNVRFFRSGRDTRLVVSEGDDLSSHYRFVGINLGTSTSRRALLMSWQKGASKPRK